METIPFDMGRVVLSRQGRDKGRHFIVIGFESGHQPSEKDGFVLMSDGASRKLDHPKKKKIKHLKARPMRMDALTDLRARNVLKDSDLRSFLEANGCGLEKAPAES